MMFWASLTISRPHFSSQSRKRRTTRYIFLDITITRTAKTDLFDIFRKPTTTDTVIPHDSCHPDEHKLSAVRYLRNRNEAYIITPENRQKESGITDHILQVNKYDTSYGSKYTTMENEHNISPRDKKWVKFNYIGREVRSITKLFKHTTLKIAFTTKTTSENSCHHDSIATKAMCMKRAGYTN
jgi:hypothetical protein